jgi:hypothetical protein
MRILQTVIREYEGHRSAAIVLRDNTLAHSNQPKKFFSESGADYEVLDLDYGFDNAEQVIDLLYLEYTIPLTRAIYERVQVYGGAEEGGWYYYTLHPTEGCEDESLELNGYGEGFVERYELVTDEFKKTNREIYM